MEEIPVQLPAFIVDGVQPLICFEARLIGSHTSALVSQLGLSVDAPDYSLAIFTRTSGVLLVVGAGSYAAYRICTRLLGQRFVSLLVDGAAYDALASADRRLLYAQDGGLGIIREETDEDEEGAAERENSPSEWRSRHSATSITPSEFSLSRVRRSMRVRGLFSIRARRSSREGVLRREGSRPESSVLPGICSRTGASSDSSAASSAARVLSGAGRRRLTSASSQASDASASLRIVWEGQQMWEDEFADESALPHATHERGPRLPSGGDFGLHPSPSMGDMCSVFDDVLSMVSTSSVAGEQPAARPPSSTSRIQRVGRVSRRSVPSGAAAEGEEDDEIRIRDILNRHDPSYMYQSVVVLGSEFGGSDAASTASRVSSRNRQPGMEGLWGLSDPPTTSSHLSAWPSRVSRAAASPSTSVASPLASSSMTDSGAVLTQSTHSKTTSIGKRSMFDSAIGAEISLSSDEEGLLHSAGCRSQPRLSSEASPIEEESTPRRNRNASSSAASLEWFDEDGLPLAESSLRRIRLDDPGERPVIGSEAAPDSRDLIVFAKERFAAKSSQFKLLADLYSTRRLRRVSRAVAASSRAELSSLLLSAAYHQVPLLREQPTQLIQRIRCGFDRYNALRRWRLAEAGWEGLLAAADSVRTALSQVSEALRNGEDAVNGLLVLLALRVCELFDQKMAGSAKLDWLAIERPDDVIQRLERADFPFSEMEWQLVADTFCIRLDIVDVASSKPSLTTVRPSTSQDPGDIRTLSFLRLIQHQSTPATLVPLYHVPD